MVDRQLAIKVDGQAREAWRLMLDAVCRAGFPVAVVTKDPGNAEGAELARFEGVLIEVDDAWLRVQPVDADGLPCSSTEMVHTVEVDHVQVYSREAGEWLEVVGFTRDGAFR